MHSFVHGVQYNPKIKVRDTVKVNDELVEDTLVMGLAQEKDDNVWYFGENSADSLLSLR